MSTVTGASDRSTAGETAPSLAGSASPRWRRGAALAALTAALVAIPFVTGGGVDEITASAGNTWTEIALMLLGVITVAASLLYGVPGRRRTGAVTVGLMALLFALEAASIAWSAAPDSSWLASGQMLAYLMVFAGAVALARLAPAHWTVLLGALTAAAAALCAWSLIVKVFPASLAPGNHFGRLQAPFGYWNALALAAALGVPGCLWLGARRDGGRRVAALAVPAMTLVLVVLVLSYSRSADLAALVAAIVWLAFTPLRLRAAAVLAVGAAGAAVISGWALLHHALSHDSVAPSAQDHAGHSFGIVLAVVLVVMLLAGVALAGAVDRSTISEDRRRRIGSALIGLVVLAVIAAIGGLAASSRGLTGQISHAWHQLTSTTGSADTAGRVLGLGSSRSVYWHEALTVGNHAALKGVGELGFSIAHLRYTSNPETVQQAHSYVLETYADLGTIGLVVTAALLVSWLLATGRTLTVGRGRELDPRRGAERSGLITLAAIVVGFGVQSMLDWTWFFAGVTVPALLAAGWLTGCGPVTERPSRAAPATRPSPLDRPLAVALVPVLIAAAVLGCWLVWRPLHSAQLVNDAENGAGAHVFADARAAHSADPLSLLPDTLLSTLYQSARQRERARAVLLAATRAEPQNPSAWAALATFDVQRHAWTAALPSLRKVQALDHTPDAISVTNDSELGTVAAHLPQPTTP